MYSGACSLSCSWLSLELLCLDLFALLLGDGFQLGKLHSSTFILSFVVGFQCLDLLVFGWLDSWWCISVRLIHMWFELASLPSRDAWKSYPRCENQVVSEWGMFAWHQGTGFTLVTTGAFGGRWRETEDLQLLARRLQHWSCPHLQWPWLQELRTDSCPQVIVSLRGRTLVRKEGTVAIRLITYLSRLCNQNQPQSTRLFFLSHRVAVILYNDNRLYFTGRYGTYIIN